MSSQSFRSGPCSELRLVAVLLAVLLPVACASPTQRAPVQSDPSEFSTGESGEQGESGDIAPELVPVYFDFNRSAIRTDQRGALAENASHIMEGYYGSVVIEGHCDERGSEEYNLALGERRADAVRQYLVDRGVDGSQLETVSYGESRPAVRGSSESAWSMNRRTEFRTDR